MFALLLAASLLHWSPWSPAVLQKASSEHRLVLIDVEAVWCHWCHVMDETTYRDPKVVKLLREHFVAVKVDQDASPGLAARYERWGWPATVVLAADGRELVKLRGYLEPGPMAKLLAALVKDPTPRPDLQVESKVAPAEAPLLSAGQRGELRARHQAAFDEELAGWGRKHKLIWAEPLELDLLAARAGDQKAASRARRTLDAALSLLDPIWGGFYQYSVGDWNHAHYEKIMAVQADAIRIYSLAYEVLSAPEYLRAARATAGYLDQFLSDQSGGFHGTQDADVSASVAGHAFYPLDDAGRRKLGMPRVDPHLYARDAGLAAEALVALYGASGEEASLERAKAAVRFAVRERAAPGGAFRHGAAASAQLALSDTLAVGRAALALHTATGDPEWLPLAESAAGAIAAHFCSGDHAGCAAAELEQGAAGVFAEPTVNAFENAVVARFANLLSRVTGVAQHRALAERAARFLLAPAVLARDETMPETLLADAELAGEPVHVTIVGPLLDAGGRALHAAALRFPSSYRRVDLWDGKGPLPANTKVRYPASDRPTAFACGARSCSAPVTDPRELAAAIELVLKSSARAEGP